ncbi:MAG TPA: SAF domain-containing protein [Propionicimonas sp.]
MKTEQRVKAPGRDGTPGPVASPMAVGRSRLQRSPLLIVLGVLVLAAGAVFGWFMWATTSTATEVVAARVDVERGQMITGQDLTTVRVTIDPSMRTVPGSDLQALVGQRAAADLSAGTLVSPDQVTDVLLPPTGMSVVSVPIDAGLVPSVPIRAGDTVRLVQTPATGGELASTPLTVTAEVVSVAVDDPTTVVNVLVPSDKAGDLAALAATGRVALVLDSRTR